MSKKKTKTKNNGLISNSFIFQTFSSRTSTYSQKLISKSAKNLWRTKSGRMKMR